MKFLFSLQTIFSTLDIYLQPRKQFKVVESVRDQQKDLKKDENDFYRNLTQVTLNAN